MEIDTKLKAKYNKMVDTHIKLTGLSDNLGVLRAACKDLNSMRISVEGHGTIHIKEETKEKVLDLIITSLEKELQNFIAEDFNFKEVK